MVPDVNDGRGGRPRISNNAFTPKMEYPDNQGIMDGGDLLDTEPGSTGYSPGIGVDNGKGRGLKRRVQQVR